jgi:peptidoglycan/LPS O-acetylase OafA/YrhL
VDPGAGVTALSAQAPILDAPAPTSRRTAVEPAQRNVLATLHGVRGIAAIAVVAWHLAVLPWSSFHPASGYLAVDLFFVLSGIVLAHAYDARLATDMSAGRFMTSRLIRVYPLYIIGLLLTSAALLLAFVVGAKTNWSIASFGIAFSFALFFSPTPPLHNNAIFPLNNPAWSLFFELVANVAFAVLWRRFSARALAGVITVSALLLVGAAVRYGSLDLGSNWPTFWAGFPRVTFSFFLGVVLSRVVRGRAFVLTVNPWLILLALAVVLSVDPGPWRVAYDLGCVLVILPLLVWAGALVEPRGVSRAIFVSLGAASYPIYMIHVPLITIAAKTLGPAGSWLGPAFGGIFIVAMVGAGLVLNRVDQVIRARLTQGLRHRSRGSKAGFLSP